MRIQTQDFKKLKEQFVDLRQGVNLLIGPNGSGKSSFLEYVFKNNTTNTCVAYSSGINESFSHLYKFHLNKLVKEASKSFFSYSSLDEEEEENNNLKFFFTKEWAPFLIYVSSFLSNDGSHTKKWLDNFGLKVTSFEFTVQTSSYYRKKIKASLDSIESGHLDFGPESSRVHKLLSALVNDEEGILNQPKIRVSNGNNQNPEFTRNARVENSAYDYLFRMSLFSQIDELAGAGNIGVARFFQLLQVLSTGKRPIIPLAETEMSFINSSQNVIQLSQLSDGEFQLLLLSSLLDLFDSTNSIFILDEVDAHIHPKLIRDVWSSFDGISGYAVTSTHNIMTISVADFNKIIFLESGQILSDHLRKNKLVETLCGAFFAEPVWKSLLYTIETIYLFDGLGDWEIFKAICLKQGLDFERIERNSIIIPRNSDTQRNNRADLIKPKEIWVDDFLRSTSNAEVDQSRVKLKNFILICDSDSYSWDEERKPLDFSTIRKRAFGVTSIIWNRRSIENYLISPSARLISNNTPSTDFVWGEIMDFGDVTENNLSDRSRKRMNCKPKVQTFINTQMGLSQERLSSYVSNMDAADIDPYIQLVFNKIFEMIGDAAR